MNKPNITPAPWQSNGKGEIFRWGNGPETKGYYPRIAKVSIWKDDKAMGSANAKAIKEVPNMINELVDVYDWMIHLKLSHPHLVSDEQIGDIEEALKKAGVTEL